MPVEELRNYRWRGARALVLLHERAVRELVETWRRAQARGIRLPESKDHSYESLASLMRHALSASRGYIEWLCDALGLPNPAIVPVPEVRRLAESLDDYMEHLLRQWRSPLADVEDSRFFAVHKTEDEEMTCLAMLEHAVMHPIRHRFQLEELLESL